MNPLTRSQTGRIRFASTLARPTSSPSVLRRFGGATVTLLGVSFACCSDSEPAEKGTPLSAQCRWGDFEAIVREGPDKDLTYKGALVAGLASDGVSVFGTLFTGTDGPAGLPVRGDLAGTNLTLHFLDGTREIVGMGTAPMPGVLCKENLQGTLEGPTNDDSGDWIGTSAANIANLTQPPVELASDAPSQGTINASSPLSPKCTEYTEGHNIGGGVVITVSTIVCVNGNTTCTTHYFSNGDPVIKVCETRGSGGAAK